MTLDRALALQETEFFDFPSDGVQAFIEKAVVSAGVISHAARGNDSDAYPDALRAADPDAYRDDHAFADQEELAFVRLQAVYLAVRDGISYNPYRIPLQREYYKASRIARMKSAYCIPKSILFAACARSLGFRSWIGFADVVNHLSSQRLLDYLGTDVFAFHGYAVVEVKGRRVKTTPVFDARLCKKFGVEPLSFDGENDSIFQPFDAEGKRFMEYVRERGEYADFPFEAVMDGFAEVYPHLIGRPMDGDLMTETIGGG